jgi:hypothetical protein
VSHTRCRAAWHHRAAAGCCVANAVVRLPACIALCFKLVFVLSCDVVVLRLQYVVAVLLSRCCVECWLACIISLPAHILVRATLCRWIRVRITALTVSGVRDVIVSNHPPPAFRFGDWMMYSGLLLMLFNLDAT